MILWNKNIIIVVVVINQNNEQELFQFVGDMVTHRWMQQEANHVNMNKGKVSSILWSPCDEGLRLF